MKSPPVGYCNMARKEGKFDSIRKFLTTSGIVEVINVPKGRGPTYAWITTEYGDEVSLKLTPELIAKLEPGHTVQMTTSKSSGKLHILSTEPNASPLIPISGTAKYLNRTRNGWAIAVTTRSQRLKRKPLLKARLLVQPNFSQGERVTFLATFDGDGPSAIKEHSLKLDCSQAPSPTQKQSGTLIPKGACDWLSKTLGVDAALHQNLRGFFEHSVSPTDGQVTGSLLTEEKVLRAKYEGKRTNLEMQAILEAGLHTVQFIDCNDGAAIRQIKNDLMEADSLGLYRRTTILTPIHDLANPKSFYGTMATKLLDPNYLHLISVHLLGNQQLETTKAELSQVVCTRIAAITVDSSIPDGTLPSPIHHPLGIASKSQKLWRTKAAKQALKMLVPVRDEREILKALRRSARVATEDHPLRRFFHPVVTTFESHDDCEALQKAIKSSTKPLFMAPLHQFFSATNKVFNLTTTKQIPPGPLYEFLEARWCYAISPTRYRFSSLLSWSELVVKLQGLHRGETDTNLRHSIVSLTNGIGDLFTLRQRAESTEATPQFPPTETVLVSNLPSYVSYSSVLMCLKNLKIEFSAAHTTKDGKSVIISVPRGSQLLSDAKKGTQMDTDLGPVSISIAHPNDKGPEILEPHMMRSTSNLQAIFGQGKRNEPNKEEDQTEREKKLDEKENKESEESEVVEDDPNDRDSPVTHPCETLGDAFAMISRTLREREKSVRNDRAREKVDNAENDNDKERERERRNEREGKRGSTKEKKKGGRNRKKATTPDSGAAPPDFITAPDTVSDSRSRLRTLVGEMLDRETKRLLSPILNLLLSKEEETLELLIRSKQDLDIEVAEAVKMLEKEEKLHEFVEIELAQDQKHHAQAITCELMKLDDNSYSRMIEDDDYLAEIVNLHVKKLASQSATTSTTTISREKMPGQETSSRHRSPPISRTPWAEIEEDRNRHDENKEPVEDSESNEDEKDGNKQSEQDSQTEDEDREDDDTSSPNKKRLKQINSVDNEASGRNRK